jgi:hypothetical protein
MSDMEAILLLTHLAACPLACLKCFEKCCGAFGVAAHGLSAGRGRHRFCIVPQLQLSDFEKHIGRHRDGFVGGEHLFFKFEKGCAPMSSNSNEWTQLLVGLTPPVYGYHRVKIGEQSLSVLVLHRMPTVRNALEETINGPFRAGIISSVIDRVSSVLILLEVAAVKMELFCADWTPSNLATLVDTAYLVYWVGN